MSDLLKQMGNRIYNRRKQLRLTQEELAEKAGITPQTISSAELGKKALRPENIIRICTSLEISTDYLLLGKTTGDDRTYLQEKISSLSPSKYRHLEDIVNSYVAAVQDESKDTTPDEDSEWHVLM